MSLFFKNVGIKFKVTMSQKLKFLSVLWFGVSNINLVTSQRNNENWPEDNTTPFPYPTPGPIDLKTSIARYLETPSPLTFNSHYLQQAIATNSGKDLIIKPNQNEKNEYAVITGGILYDNVYKFFRTEYFWDLGLNSDAANRLDGVGSPVEVEVSYFNTKYGSKKNATNKRDGIVQIVLFIYVTDVPNINFYPFQLQLQPIKKAGSSTLISEYFSYLWYFQKSSIDDYYAYPGTYTDLETGKIYNSSTVIILVRSPQPSISFSQFNATFRSFQNTARKPYSHVLSAVSQGERPVIHSKGLVREPVSQKE